MTDIESTLVKRLEELNRLKEEYLGWKEEPRNLCSKERGYIDSINSLWRINRRILRRISPKLKLDSQ